MRSGYSIYNQKRKRSVIRKQIAEAYPPLPDKRYDIVYADPPWDYGGKMQFDKSANSSVNIEWNKDIFVSAADFKYPTMKLDEMAGMNIQKIAKDDSLLFMWTTGPQMKNSIILGESWGFDYKTVAFVWDKMTHNPGHYTLSYTEMCLVFKRGRIPMPRGQRNIKQIVREKRREHSRKPDEVRRRIELMFPSQDKIELFAREFPENWDVWGIDVMERK